MLSPSEKIGLSDILDYLDDEGLFSVLETVTKRMFTARNRQEAIKKILSCTAQPSDLLKRQKITKRILFNYLVNNKGAVILADWTKLALVKKCLEVWGSTESCKENDYIEQEIARKANDVTEVTSHMGFEFSKWFFRILNALDGFGPEHFWPNCSLYAQLCTYSDQIEVSQCGAENVASFLINLIAKDKYYFSPNESTDSIQFELEAHGLVKILIHGVLHQHSNCIGIFDSFFGLVKNPEFEDTYKIQVIKVKLQVNTPGAIHVNNHLPIC